MLHLKKESCKDCDSFFILVKKHYTS